MRTAILSAALLSIIVFVRPLAAQDDEDTRLAAAAYKEGKASFQKGAYARALESFTEAYNISGKPDLLYNMAVCNEKLGENDKAIAFYQLYLEEKPDADDKDAVTATINRLSSEDEAAPKAAPPVAAVPLAKNEEKPPPAKAPAAKKPADSVAPVESADPGATVESDATVKRHRLAQGLLMGGGAMVAVAGALTGVGAYKKYNSFEATCAPDCSSDQASQVRALTITTDVLIFTGAAVAAAGLIWLLVDLHRARATDADSASYSGRAPFAMASFGGVSFQGEF